MAQSVAIYDANYAYILLNNYTFIDLRPYSIIPLCMYAGMYIYNYITTHLYTYAMAYYYTYALILVITSHSIFYHYLFQYHHPQAFYFAKLWQAGQTPRTRAYSPYIAKLFPESLPRFIA